jgi:hypothetical protein
MPLTQALLNLVDIFAVERGCQPKRIFLSPALRKQLETETETASGKFCGATLGTCGNDEGYEVCLY